MKRSGILTGLAAGLLSIGLVLAGCEGPTGADGSPGGGGAGPNGSIVLSGPEVTAAELVAAFANSALAVIPGNVIPA
jgi:hypothetical protein